MWRLSSKVLTDQAPKHIQARTVVFDHKRLSTVADHREDPPRELVSEPEARRVMNSAHMTA